MSSERDDAMEVPEVSGEYTLHEGAGCAFLECPGSVFAEVVPGPHPFSKTLGSPGRAGVGAAIYAEVAAPTPGLQSLVLRLTLNGVVAPGAGTVLWRRGSARTFTVALANDPEAVAAALEAHAAGTAPGGLIAPADMVVVRETHVRVSGVVQ